MAKVSKDYTFNFTQDYSYESTVIKIDGGKAKLVSPYATDNPYLSANESLIASEMNSFTETSTLGTGTLIKYLLSVNNQAKYWDGAAWVDSTGIYAEANLASEINTNALTLLNDRARLKLSKVFLNSSGTNTPQLDNINISYDFTGYCLPDDIRSALINVPNENVKDEQLITYIELADQEIDSYIGQIYTLPITGTESLNILRAYSISHAAYNVYGYIAAREGNGVSSFATKKYEELLKKLKKIGNGEMSLVGKTDTSQVAGSGEDYKPTFDQGDIESQNVDPDLIDDINSGSYIG